MSDQSHEQIVDELVTWFANRLHILKGDTSTFFEDLLVANKVHLAQNDRGHLAQLINQAICGSWASHRALMELFRSKLLHAPELQDYAACHENKGRKPGPKHNWSFDGCILSAVSLAMRMKSGLCATRNPSLVKTSDDEDFGDEETQSACTLVARALQRLGELIAERQPPELVALFGKLTRKDIEKFMREEGTI